VAGQLLINGGFRPDGPVADVYSCDFLLNGALLGASNRNQVKGAGADESCETSDGAKVGKGNYTVELRAVGIAATNEVDDVSLQVQFVPNP
jgi:hypothetical protein